MSRAPLLSAAGLLLILGGLGARAEEAPSVTVALSPTEIEVGDLIEANLTVEIDPGAGEASFPAWEDRWGSAEIRATGEVQREEGDEVAGIRTRYSQTLRLTAFRPGSVVLPPQTVTIKSGDDSLEILTDPATFNVGSVLPAGDQPLEPKPPAPPQSLPIGSRFWWAAGLLAALAIGLGAFLLSRRRADSAYSGTLLDPWDALEVALAKLASAADADTVFTGLSLELRRYLGSTLAFPAAESTTTELRRRLLRSGLPPTVSGDVVRLLVEADSVKFAKKSPAPGRIEQCLEQTRIAATEVRNFLRPEVPEGDGNEEAA